MGGGEDGGVGMRGKALKLKSILILFMAGFIFAALGISGGISFRMFEGAMVDKIGDSRADVLSQISEKISGIKMSMDLLSDLYFYNENLTALYKKEGYSWEDRRRIRENFERIEELSAMTSTVMEMDFYYAFLMENGYCYSSNPGAEGSLEDYKDRIWFPDVLDKGECLISTHKNGEGRDVVSIARSLRDETGAFAGLFLFHIYEENFSQVYQGLSAENNIYIVDRNGNIVSHRDKNLLGIRFYDMELLGTIFQGENSVIIEKMQKEYLFSIVQNEELDWILAEEIPMELLLDDVKEIKMRMIGTGLVLFAAGLLVCVYIAHRTTSPLGELVQELTYVGRSEDATQSFAIRGWSEIHRICEECNYMMGRIRSLVTEIKESERRKRAAEMGFLQAQMSPHFLYNTLFSIRCLVDMGDKGKAIGIIDAFTSILKYILSYKSEFADVSQEIKFLEDYAVLQKYRYGDQFHLEIVCGEELYQKKILRMILEPLIENSLFHGLSDKKDEIHVAVIFEIREGDMVITVQDDGAGFTDENYRHLNQKLRGNEQSNMIGMNNIRDRIKTTFGKRYGLSIDMNYTQGAKIIVKIPVIE